MVNWSNLDCSTWFTVIDIGIYHVRISISIEFYVVKSRPIMRTKPRSLAVDYNSQPIETVERDVLDFRRVDARIRIEMKFVKYSNSNEFYK